MPLKPVSPRHRLSTALCVEKSYICPSQSSVSRQYTGVTRQFVIYQRVSSTEQGKSGLGLEAQERDIQLFLENYAETPYEVVERFVEVHSGKDNQRPLLTAAIAWRRRRRRLWWCQTDRLSRRVSFIASLMEDRDFDFLRRKCHTRISSNSTSMPAWQSRTDSSLKGRRQHSQQQRHEGQSWVPKQHLEALAAARQEKALKEAQKVSGVIVPLRKAGASLRSICDAQTAQEQLPPEETHSIRLLFHGCFSRWRRRDEVRNPVSRHFL